VSPPSHVSVVPFDPTTVKTADPVGTPAPGGPTEVTEAVNVTGSPVTKVLAELVTPTVAVAFATCWVRLPEVLVAKLLSPEYVAVTV
jgi:hypothetical protein